MGKSVYLLRHAEPKIDNGIKGSLSDRGAQQAIEVGRKLAQYIPGNEAAMVITSPSLRCRESARLIAERLDIVARQLPLRLKNADSLSTNDVQSKYSAYLASYKILGVESPDAYARRFAGIVQDLNASVVIAVCNEVNMRIVLQFFGGKQYNIPIAHTQVFRLVFTSGSGHASVEGIYNE